MPEPSDPADQPPPDPEDAHELLYPFTVCTSAGGPYDDDTFTAGYQVGALDQALRVAHACSVDTISRVIFATLADQAELVGMARGFAIMTRDADPDGPTWVCVTFTRTTEADSI
jgi:hypothetical protein